MFKRAAAIGAVGAFAIVMALGQPAPGPRVDPQETKPSVVAKTTVSIDPTWAVKTPEDACSRGWKILGVPPRETDAEATVAVPTEDDTPFLSERVIGKPQWRVRLKNVKFLDDGEHLGSRAFDVVEVSLDPRNGALLRVETVWPADRPALWKRPDAKLAAQILTAGQESWHGFMDKPPTRSLADALRALESHTGGGWENAHQIVAYCALISDGSLDAKAAKPTWWIHLFDMGPQPMPGRTRNQPEGSEEWVRNLLDHMRHLVDDTTGQWLLATNAPDSVAPPNFKGKAGVRRGPRPPE